MKDIKGSVRFLITALRTYKLLILAGIFILPITGFPTMLAQAPDPASSIKALKEGYLIIRMPTSSAKIDTLKALIARSDDPDQKARLEKDLKTTTEERDTLQSNYINAFKKSYDFSKVAYFMDRDGHNLNTATYYNLEGERMAISDLMEKPLFYLFFERSPEMKIDALVVYDRNLKKIPKPFPNDFSRAGFKSFVLNVTGGSYETWRVGKINKRFKMYLNEVNSEM